MLSAALRSRRRVLGAAALGAVVAPAPLLQAATSIAAASASPPRRFGVSSDTCFLQWPTAPGRADPVLAVPYVDNGRVRVSTARVRCVKGG